MVPHLDYLSLSCILNSSRCNAVVTDGRAARVERVQGGPEFLDSTRLGWSSAPGPLTPEGRST